MSARTVSLFNRHKTQYPHYYTIAHLVWKGHVGIGSAEPTNFRGEFSNPYFFEDIQHFDVKGHKNYFFPGLNKVYILHTKNNIVFLKWLKTLITMTYLLMAIFFITAILRGTLRYKKIPTPSSRLNKCQWGADRIHIQNFKRYECILKHNKGYFEWV